MYIQRWYKDQVFVRSCHLKSQQGESVLVSEKTAEVIKDRERQYLVLDQLLWLGGEQQYNLDVTKRKFEVKMEGN